MSDGSERSRCVVFLSLSLLGGSEFTSAQQPIDSSPKTIPAEVHEPPPELDTMHRMLESHRSRYVYRGTTDLALRIEKSSASWSAWGVHSRWGLGRSVATGDVNGDGIDDLIIGAGGGAVQRHPGAGFIYVFHGSVSGLESEPNRILHFAITRGQLGHDLAVADMDGDGFSDLLCGSRGFADDHRWGAVSIYHGGPEGLAPSPVWIGLIDDPASHDAAIAQSVASAGDTDGDGHTDLVAGFPRFPVDGKGRGAAFLYRHAQGSLHPAPSWRRIGDPEDERYATEVLAALDVNGDGFSDLLVSAPRFGSEKKPERGRVEVFLGSPEGPAREPNHTLRGMNAESRFGSALCKAGDVNGDGCDDFWVTAAGRPNHALAPAGEAQLFLGQAQGPPTPSEITLQASLPGTRLGAAMGHLGDLNGDGTDEFVVGEPQLPAKATPSDQNRPPGRVQILSVGPGSDAETLHLSRRIAVPGHQQTFQAARFAGPCDLNGDGYHDLVVACPATSVDRELRGAVFVVYGKPTFFSTELLTVWPEAAPLPLSAAVMPAPSRSAAQIPPSGSWPHIRWWLVAGAAGVAGLALWIRQRRRQLEAVTSHVKEQEQRRIARDLHDHIGAELSQLTLLTAGPDTASSPDVHHRTRQLAEEVRDLTWVTNPGNDSVENLSDYLSEHASQACAAASITCDLDFPLDFPSQRTTPEMRRNLLLILKEALHNVIKHAGAHSVRVILEPLGAGTWSLTVGDDGCGFDVAASRSGKSGEGLANLQARADAIGADLRIESSPGAGASIEVRFAVPAERH